MLSRLFKKKASAQELVHDWHIEAMSCHHCSGKIDGVLKLQGVKKYKIDLPQKQVKIYESINEIEVKQALSLAGYEVS